MLKPGIIPALKTGFILLLIVTSSACHLLAQNIDFGKSYINVTKGLNGGTVETGDTLEIRASFVVKSGTYDSCRYKDQVPAGTSYIPSTIRVLTNEGKIYKQFTDAYADDPGWITGSTVTIHLGFTATNPATAFKRGRVVSTHKPSNFGNTCIMVASFRVLVTALNLTFISTSGGTMTYKPSGGSLTTYTFPSNTIIVYPNYGICSNTIGTNAIGTEFNGSFGSGPNRNRGTSANVPTGYSYQPFTTVGPNDYSYGIANNTSTQTNYTTLNTWAIPDNSSPTHRVFNLWDIIGDHTGAASTTQGNPAADTVANHNAGYMLVINAAYRIDSAFQQTITGLCPNTYYEVSAWMRNICSKCGCDSNGKSATTSTGPPFYIPTGPGDSSGVKPNITFELDGIDYYTTGNITYTSTWVKKGFTFLTGPVQTSFTLKFFNNAPGGGGNDWALDDISVSTCSPNMKYSPSLNPTVCDSNALVIYDTVRCYFDNYTYYKWQRSHDGGATWADVTAPSGPATPVWNGSAFEYVVSYTIPPNMTYLVNNGDMYRMVVATTSSNLSNASCNFTDGGNIITIQVLNCEIPLSVKFLSFSGIRQGSKNLLNWSVTGEEQPMQYDIEKSYDAVHFWSIGGFTGLCCDSSLINRYQFTDEDGIHALEFYRIRMRNENDHFNYSKTIDLSDHAGGIELLAISNPFIGKIDLRLVTGKKETVKAELLDAMGRSIHHWELNINKGLNQFSLGGLANEGAGVYVLRINSSKGIIQRKLVSGSH
ncbi:MAG: T9SS type A sorting domain-containing protein [Chitinophagaceae bacterium]|nr:T9SS type A sorting domain-containing protein [Chitinophagaceae bacterium]